MLLDKLRQSMNQTTKVAMRAIIDLNDEKTTKFPSQKEVPREELVKLCQILKLQLSEALGALEEKNDVHFIDAATDPMEIIEEEEPKETSGTAEAIETGETSDGTRASKPNPDEGVVAAEAPTETNTNAKDESEAANASIRASRAGAEDGTRAKQAKAKDARPICKHHKNRKCLYKKTCRFSHPKLCKPPPECPVH